MTDYPALVSQIESANSLVGIEQAVSTYSASAVGSGGILYSGNVGNVSAQTIALDIVNANAANGVTVNIINNTPRGLVLVDPDVVGAIESKAQNIYVSEGMSAPQAQVAAQNFLFGSRTIAASQEGSVANSLWGQASSEFVSSLSGNITVIGTAQQASPFGTLATVELPGLLSNQNVETVGGVAISKLQSAGTSAFGQIFSGFENAIANGGLYSLANGTSPTLTQQAFESLGFENVAAQTAAELAAAGLVEVNTTTALATVADYLAFAGSGALKFLGGAGGAALINLLTSSSPANAGEDQLLQQLNDYSDLPVSPPPLGIVIPEFDGVTKIQLPFNQLAPNGDDINFTIGGSSGGSNSGPLLVDESTFGPTGSMTAETVAAADSDGALEGSVQIIFASNSSPNTAVTVTDTNGTIQNYTVTGTPSVEDAMDSTATASGSTPTILVGGDNAQLSDLGSGVFFMIGTGGSATTGANATVDVTGNDNTVTNQGSGCTDGIHCDGDTVNSNSGTINVDTDSSATVNGNSDVINVGSDGILAAVGGSDTINLTGNIDSLDAVGNSDAISALGSGDTITLQGLSETVTATSDTLDLDAGATGTITGNNDTVLAASNVNFTLSGANEAVTITGNNVVVDATASGDTITVDGTGDYIIGSGDTVDFGANANGSVSGSSDTLFLSTGDSAGITGANNVIENDGASDWVGLNADSSATFDGTAGGQIGLLGSDASVAASGENITSVANVITEVVDGTGNVVDEAANTALTVFGGSNTIDMTGTGDSTGVNGANNIVENDGAGDWAGLAANASATFDGTAGGQIGLLGSNDSVNASGETVSTAANVTSEFVTGTGNMVYEAANTALTVSGGSNTIDMTSTGDAAGINGANNTVEIDGASDWAGLGAYSSAAFYGTAGGSIALLGSGDSINASGEIIDGVANDTGESVSGTGDAVYEAANNSFNVAGGSDTFDLTTGGDYLGLLGGSGYSVTGTSDSIATLAGTSLNLVGGNDYVSLGGTGDYLGLLGGSGYNVAGSYDQIATLAYTDVGISGSYDTVELGDHDILSMASGTGSELFASDDSIYLDNAATYVVVGNHDLTVGNQDRISDYGSDDHTVGNGDSVWASGADDSESGRYGDEPSGTESSGYAGGGYGYDYGYGAVRGLMGKAPGINVVAQYDSTHGFTDAAIATQVAFNQVLASANGSLATSAATLADEPASPAWDTTTITWSFGTPGSGSTGSPISDAIEAQYQSVIENALKAWAKASGITFRPQRIFRLAGETLKRRAVMSSASQACTPMATRSYLAASYGWKIRLRRPLSPGPTASRRMPATAPHCIRLLCMRSATLLDCRTHPTQTQ